MNCLRPIHVKGRLVPCGRCPRCRRNRQRDWTFRLRQEQQDADFLFWLALTYDEEHLPKYPTRFGDIPCVERRHCREFLEKLRKKHYSAPIKFKHFLVSEYGDHGDRPHYHCLLFCYTPTVTKLSDKHKLRQEVFDYLRPGSDRSGETAWKYGTLSYKALHSRVFSYITNYVNKPEIIDAASQHPVRPFSMISHGIGERFLERINLDQFEDLTFTISENGSRKVMPRYYRDKIFEHSLEDFRKYSQKARTCSDRGCDFGSYFYTKLSLKIAENRRKWSQKLEVTVYPQQYAKQMKAKREFERTHSISYAESRHALADNEMRIYIEKMQKRKSL